MNKNVKRIFFVLTLITLLATVGAACAADDSNSTTAVDSSVSDPVVNDNDYVAAEPVTTSNDNNVDTKTIEKEEKNLKTATKTVEVNNYDELTTTMNNAVNDTENDEYIINLNDGAYVITKSVNLEVGSQNNKNIVINGNNQTITGNNNLYTRFRNSCNITINNLTFKTRIMNYHNLTLNSVNIDNDYSTGITNRGKITSYNSRLNCTINNEGATLIISDDTTFGEKFSISKIGTIYTNNTNMIYPFTNTFSGDSTLSNITIDKSITNNGKLTLNNVTIDNKIINNNILIISDDCTITDNFILEGDGEVIINDISMLPSYNGNNTFTDKTFTNDKRNHGNLTLNNCNVEKTMTNYGNLTLNECNITGNIINEGILIIDDNTIFDPNATITGNGEIIINDLGKIISNIPILNGTYNISDATIDGNHIFIGNITFNNCNFISENNSNIGFLYLNNCTATNNNWLNNYFITVINEESNIDEKINNQGSIYKGTLPNENYYPTNYVINNMTAGIFFENNTLKDYIIPGSTLDFQGTISNIAGLTSIIIDRPVNIITSTNDGRIENFGNITYNSGASGSNITGLYTYNTQFYVRNAHNMVFDNISNVVISKGIGWGVGQTSIGHNSTNILVKNSYFYTKDNGGSSTFVFNWVDNSTLINSTVEADGNVGNLVYLTTYNVNIPSGVVPNSNNRILNNTLRGPDKAAAICWGIVLSGINNIVDGNTINYTGTGITGQWGSGVTGDYNDEQSLIDLYGNTISNNKLYNGANIQAGNIIYNNYVERGGIYANNSRVYNNTAAGLSIGNGEILVTNNTITGTTTVNSLNTMMYNRTYVIIENNTLNNIQINGPNVEFKNNNITGQINGGLATTNYTLNNNNILNNIQIATGSTLFTFECNNITGTINMLGNSSTWNNNNIIGNLNLGGSGEAAGKNNQITSNNITGNIYIKDNGFTMGNSLINNNIQGYIEIRSYDGAPNNTIKNNTIITDQPYAITQVKQTEFPYVLWEKDITNCTITNNYLKANGTYGDNSVNVTHENNTITNNTPKIELKIDTTEFTAGQTANITTSIYFEDEKITNITKGKVTFKIDGKTLKDSSGKVIYAKIINGQATIENYVVPDTWKEGSTIQAVYSGSTQCEKLTSEKENITINKEAPTLTINPVEPATVGSTITLKATITDNNKVINTGKVVFKINGKTVKDANGKVIYAKVVNGQVSVNYTIPDSYKAGTYTITATYIGTDYDKLEASESLTVTKA